MTPGKRDPVWLEILRFTPTIVELIGEIYFVILKRNLGSSDQDKPKALTTDEVEKESEDIFSRMLSVDK